MSSALSQDSTAGKCCSSATSAPGSKLQITVFLAQESTDVPAFVCFHIGISLGHDKCIPPSLKKISENYCFTITHLDSRFHVQKQKIKKKKDFAKKIEVHTLYIFIMKFIFKVLKA